ncbi:dynein axonemal heavy chain 2 [Venturia canescens]|uniref:dynein axonemal heavy chain 2 n=1 Tax=Venturia canescens TaxID=32260 RepID=UPI001C9BBE06|nr:dynein axonemal heavy chain 2 [Venturia canescens]
MQRRKDKLRGEKSFGRLDPKREYLDAEGSSSDEAERPSDLRGEHEEFPSRDEYTYDEEELDKLVQSVKKLTTLSGSVESAWTDKCDSDIREFFSYSDKTILSVYFRGSVLTTELKIPLMPVYELTYFVRDPSEMTTLKNFDTNVMFGTVNENVEATILKMTANLLAPKFYRTKTWSDTKFTDLNHEERTTCVKADFCTSLHTFLCDLTDLRYKMLGLTVIYLPLEGNDQSVEEVSADKELVKRLEGVVAHWTHQIRLALGDQDQSTPHELLCLNDEYDFWIYRYENLCGLSYQMHSPEVTHLVKILTSNQSTYVRQFVTLREEIEHGMKESKSNIEFLRFLQKPCAELNNCKNPEEITPHLSKILHKFRVVWLNSPFFNHQDRITNLFNALHNQIIVLMQSFVDFKDIFAGNTRRNMQIFVKCIATWQDYKRLYDQFSDAHNGWTAESWDLSREAIFRHIDTFISRCYNMIEICQSMIDFARMDETATILPPRFAGTKGPEFERTCQKVEKLYLEYLSAIEINSHKILDVQEATWYDDMFVFRGHMKDLEINIENLVSSVFEYVQNVEEAIASLYGFHTYMSRENLTSLFDRKTTLAWKMFGDEIQQAKREILEQQEEHSALAPYYAGRALNLRSKTKRLEHIKKMFAEACWLPHCSMSDEVYHQFEILVGWTRDATNALYHRWLEDAGTDFVRRLDRYLMKQKIDKPGLLECNFDPDVQKLCHEARYWSILQFEIPVHIQVVNTKWNDLQFVYESVLAVVLAYNKIIEDAYIKDCCAHTESLQELVDTYKKSNFEIMKICENICDTPVMKIKPNYTYKLHEFREELQSIRHSVYKILVENYSMIIQYLLVIFEGFQPVIEESTPEWKNYLAKLDTLLEEAFKLCLKKSLNVMYEALHGDGTTSPSPLLLLQADLVANKMIISPEFSAIATFVGNILSELLEPLTLVPRIVERFNVQNEGVKSLWQTYAHDESFNQIQESLNNEAAYCFGMLQTYQKTWEPFRDMWEVNKDLFIQRYEKLKPTVVTFDADIARYAEVANNVQMQETITSIHFVEVNAERLKAAIVEQCALWQHKLTQLLLRMTEAKVDHVYKYIAENAKLISKEPTDLITMQTALQLFKRLSAEIPNEEEEFPKIREQYQTLEKYEVPMTFEFKRKVKDVERSWHAYCDLLSASELKLQDVKEQFKSQLLEQALVFKSDCHALVSRFHGDGPFTSDWQSKDAFTWLDSFRRSFDFLRETENQLKLNLAIFGISQPTSLELNDIEKDLTAIELVWKLTGEWDVAWEQYKTVNFWTIEMDEMNATANILLRKLSRLSKELNNKNWEIVEHSRLRVDTFRRTLPLITDLKNPALRERHWRKVKETVGRDFDEASSDFTLDTLADIKIQNFSERVSEISMAATMELAIETNLKNISDVWKIMPVEMVAYKDKGIFRLKTVDDIIQTLEDHLIQLSAMKSTSFVEPFVAEVDYWERALSTVAEVLEMVLSVQRSYMYLDNTFNAEDIRKQLPKETDDFDKLTDRWREITSRMALAGLVLPACHEPPHLLEHLNKLSNKLEGIQRALEQYLETKRHAFPRFYFISNDDLLEILANSKRPDRIQSHITKLFDNIKSLQLIKSVTGKYLADGMYSREGEYVEFLHSVILDGQVESWLCEVEKAMQDCLREVLRQCRGELRKMLRKRDKWVREWPSQPGITATQIQWTNDCTRTLLHCKLLDSRKPLKKLRKKQNQALAEYTEAIKGNLNKLQRLKFKAIVVIEIHARDVIEKLYKSNCRDVSTFEWLSQLRFYWDRDIDDCIVRQTNTFFVYGYEYLGNSERLVITPLTDRCYITLTTALHLYRGGSPKGPAGTGKTETVKDLGKALGFNVIVQNCSEGLDYKSMGRQLSGLAQTGAWGCFDEFNRINIEVLSVVAQQILSILSALSQKLTNFVFDGKQISLVHTCGLFITMNPGYAGRTELPDNLKSMFRPISMMVPDSSMIAEINLFGEGFQNSRLLAKKVFTLYALAQQQLSKQDHYDFGLRGIVTLTRYAGKKRRIYSNLSGEEVIILAMNDMNRAKLTSADLALFIGITSDLFPGVEVASIDYEEFTNYIRAEALKMKIQPVSMLLTKVVQLYETKSSRHSTMIVGRSNTAKSITWKILRNTTTAMKLDGKLGYNSVSEYPINPKALGLAELYGEYNLSTGEWLDGVISSIMRKTCAETTPEEKWILFDGPVDAVWIENLNSLMDDNKILTLVNNDRITMPEQVSLLFEVEDLAVASPATVSRAGMVYNDYKDLGWRPLVDSWLDKYKDQPEFVEQMNEHFEWYVDKILEFKQLRCKEIIAIPELNAVESLCKLLDIFATRDNGVELGDDKDVFDLMCRLWFLFCMIWSLGVSVDEEGRQRMDNFIREMEGSFPLKDTIYEYYVDGKQRSFVSWEEKLPPSWKFQAGTPFYEIIVPTVDTIRYQYLVGMLLSNGYPVMLVGPVSTGKTSAAQSVLNFLDRNKYSPLTINMSAQTTSNNVQEAIESRMEKRTRGTYIPISGKTMITFMDDFNMPLKETYGSQPPLELIRQWMGYGFWYDRQKQVRKYIQKMQLLTAMGPPGGGRHSITERLLTRFNVINMTFPAEKQITRIYGTMLTQHLLDFHPEIKGLCGDITSSTIEMYNKVVLKMLPTPAKMHYLFNLRDISKVFQGLLRSHKDYQYSKHIFLRLWIHELFRVFSDRLIDDKDREWFVSELGEQLGKYFELTFHNVCPEKYSPIFGHFLNAGDVYEDILDMGVLRRHVESQIDEYNASPDVRRLDLILFKDAIEHICRIVRVISQPRGNMLLIGIGGSGRQSLARIAAYMCELNTFEIEVTRQYRVLEFREDLKTLYSLTGVEVKPTSFLLNDTQVVEEQFLEIVNNMLSTGEVANLYKPEEMEDIKNRLTKDAAKAGILATMEAIYLFLIQRVRRNMHVVLCMSPIGNAFRNRLRQYPSLVNCTTIDWFLPWPREALLEVGNKFLSGLNLVLTILGDDKQGSATAPQLQPLPERMRDAVASTFSLIHDSVVQFSRRMATEMKRYNYVTPTNFLELVTRYKEMLTSKRSELVKQADKLRGGLFKIDDTSEKVQEMTVELGTTQQQVISSTRECEEFLGTIVNQRRDADETQKLVTAKSIRITEESKDCKRLEEIARADLAVVEPALDEAMKALDALNKKDLSEIKSFTRPPVKVEMVMEAVMILKNAEPSWAESKRQLGDVNFLNTLRDFDKDHISDKTLKTIRKYTSNPEFDPIKVGVVSIAAKSLCMWVIAMEQYGKLYKIVAPKREKLEAALKSLRQKEEELTEAVAQLQKLHEELERLQQMYDAKMKEKEDLIRLAELLKLKLERAALLVDGLSGERIRWQQTVHSLGIDYDYLPGDCLISTAFVSYLGPFVSGYREELVRSWCQEVSIIVNDLGIPLSTKFDIKEFLGDPATIREWKLQGLPSDGFSAENGIIITRSSRWPLVIDPQCQAIKWIKNMEASNGLKVIDFGQSDFTQILNHAVQFGKPVLIKDVDETLDSVLNPILQRAFFLFSGDIVMIKFNDKMVKYNDRFRLFITTKLPNPHYAPEVASNTTLCNFAIKQQGLEAQLLAIVVRKEKPQLEEQKDTLVLTIANGKRTLKELEDKILYLLSATSGSLLDDLDLLNTLQTSKSTCISVEESLETTENMEIEIDRAREAYRPCSKRAAILFFVLNDMSCIDPMYQFSLDSYINIFNVSIERSPKIADLDERIEALNEFHTYAVYKNTCRGLFEHHKLLFSFHMCIKILEDQNKINPSEYDFLLRGGIVLDRENQPDNPVRNWLPDEAWDNIIAFDKLPGFHGIISSFEQFPRDWHAWYMSPEPESKTLVGEWEENSNEFQKMLFVRSCRLDRLSFCITTFIVHNVGRKFVDPPVLDIKEVLDVSVAQSPLIFVLSPGVDPTNALMQLVENENMRGRFMSLSLGQGQAPIATRMIQIGAKEGSWVFLANCHLSLSWMPKLDKIVDILGASKALHPKFRLWLSSSPTPHFPISILQAGIKMTTEPPKGLKANMKRLYGLMTESLFDVCQAKGKYKKLFFSLVFFHSILLERKKFQQLGWNVIYSFNDSDFEVSENLLQTYLDEYAETPWESLKYMIAEVCYGGHVTDNWDRRLLLAYVQQYFNEEVLTSPYYRLSSLATYYVPRDGSLESYRDFITMLPTSDKPEAFGQHANAYVASLITDTKIMFQTLMSLQIEVYAGDEDSGKADKIMQLVVDMASKIPECIDYESTEKLMGPNKSPLDVVLLQEITCYNGLLMKARSSLTDLEGAIKGLVLMTDELENVFTCMYEARVPAAWLTAYPSLKPLGSWTRDFISRVEHFASWAQTTHPPLLFWLSAYIFPTGFLTAVLQTFARLSNLPIDLLSWEFNVIAIEGSAIVEAPTGVYVKSIFLEGAGWDKQSGCLVEPSPMQLITGMPVIHFRPVETLKKKTKGMYNCPCYYYPDRAGGAGRPSFVVAVDLKCGSEAADHWIKRGTALLLSLAE